jgi:hypothetical protein
MTERPDTRDERLLELYRRAPRAEPPAGLDAVIRAAARDALRRPRRTWTVPALATAAVLVLAVGLVVQQTRLPDLAEVERAPESGLREAPRPAAAPAPGAEEPATRKRELAPAFPPAAGAPAARPQAVERALEPRARQAPRPLLDESAADRLDAAECPPLPPELAADRGLLDRRIAELLEQGETQAAECLRRAAALDARRPGAEQ